MSLREVENVLGPPSDENAYVTGKAFIPWYFGRDRTRRAYFYRRVTRVEYDPNETGRAK